MQVPLLLAGISSRLTRLFLFTFFPVTVMGVELPLAAFSLSLAEFVTAATTVKARALIPTSLASSNAFTLARCFAMSCCTIASIVSAVGSSSSLLRSGSFSLKTTMHVTVRRSDRMNNVSNREFEEDCQTESRYKTYMLMDVGIK